MFELPSRRDVFQAVCRVVSCPPSYACHPSLPPDCFCPTTGILETVGPPPGAPSLLRCSHLGSHPLPPESVRSTAHISPT